MKCERSFLIAFLGSYLVNTPLLALVYLVPGAVADTRTGFANPYYIAYLALSAVVVALLTRWVLSGKTSSEALKAGISFGVMGFVIIVLTTLLNNISSLLFQTGSLGQLSLVFGNFVKLFASMQTLVILGEWIIPAALMGYLASRKASAPAPAPSMGMPQ